MDCGLLGACAERDSLSAVPEELLGKQMEIKHNEGMQTN